MKTVALILTLCYCTYGFKFAENFKVCSQKESKLNECLNEAIEIGIKMIGTKGIPSLGVPPIEPFFMKQYEILVQQETVKLDQYYSDINVYGYSNAKVEQAKYNPQKKVLSFTTKFPQNIQAGKYNYKGTVLGAAVYGKGDSKIIYTDVTYKHKLKFVEENKEGKQYFKVIKYDVVLSENGAHFNMTNLFDGDQKRAEQVLKASNDNWERVMAESNSYIANAYSNHFIAIVNKLFSQIPLVEIFPN